MYSIYNSVVDLPRDCLDVVPTRKTLSYALSIHATTNFALNNHLQYSWISLTIIALLPEKVRKTSFRPFMAFLCVERIIQSVICWIRMGWSGYKALHLTRQRWCSQRAGIYLSKGYSSLGNYNCSLNLFQLKYGSSTSIKGHLPKCKEKKQKVKSK